MKHGKNCGKSKRCVLSVLAKQRLSGAPALAGELPGVEATFMRRVCLQALDDTCPPVSHHAARSPGLEVLFRVFVVDECSKCLDFVSGIWTLGDSSALGCSVDRVVRSVTVRARLKQSLHTFGDTRLNLLRYS